MTHITLEGKYNTAKVFTHDVEEEAIGQIIEMLNHDITDNTTVRIMPDVHYGKGSTIGTTIKLPENKDDWKISPNIVGVDIGCGIFMRKLNITKDDIDFEDLDRHIRENVPFGFSVHDSPINNKYTDFMVDNLSDDFKEQLESKNLARIHNSLGTLGGGNHFIELGEDSEGGIWLSVHSGSRNIGLQIATYHQKVAQELTGHKVKSKDLAYLEGHLLDKYLNDMELAQLFANQSRQAMLDIITDKMGWETLDEFDSIHNFINVKEGVIRKGATSAREDERLVIPLNMRDGSIIARGLGNEDWNNSAPHGSGRKMARGHAKRELDLDEFKEQMKDIYSTSVRQDTLDEAPNAYKDSNTIIDLIEDTVEIIDIIKPIYNFKA